MQNRWQTLSKKKDFDAVFKNNRFFYCDFLGIKIAPNDLSNNRWGILVGLKVSKKAVVRNLIKRRIREIIREFLPNLKQGYDVAVLTKPEIKNADFQEIKKALFNCFKKSNLFNK